MNDRWNRPGWWPWMMPFGTTFNAEAMPPSPSGGILGDFGSSDASATGLLSNLGGLTGVGAHGDASATLAQGPSSTVNAGLSSLPLPYLDSAKYWSALPPASSPSERSPGHGPYSSSVPQAPGWDQIPNPTNAGGVNPSPEPLPTSPTLPVDDDPFARAALRVRRSVHQPRRPEIPASFSPTDILAHEAVRLSTLPQRLFEASEQLHRTGEYDPAPGTELMQLLLPVGRGRPGGPLRPGKIADAGRTADAIDPLAGKPPIGRTAGVHAPPDKPPRPFSVDYPAEPPIDSSGRLVADIEGRPLTAKYVAGRQVAGGEDMGLTPLKILDLATEAMGRPPELRSLRTLDERTGRYIPTSDPKGPQIWLLRDLIPDQRGLMLGHETGHLVHDLADRMSLAQVRKLEPELKRVYSALNEGKEGLRPLKVPQDYGYTEKQAPYELVAEFLRAYLTNPNYVKTVAPNAAAWARAMVNSNPQLSRLLQLNSLGGLGVLGGAAIGADDKSAK
jgi:hypothetical protein